MDGNQENEWYRNGLRFECQGCGDCCRGPGGYVWVTEEEARLMAKTVNMSFEDFARKMLRQTHSGLALVDALNGDCPFLTQSGGCTVYAQRPVQCSSWPWWEDNLVSKRAWDDAATRCPGINKGKLHSQTHINREKEKDF